MQGSKWGHRKVCSYDYSKGQFGLLERLDASLTVGEQVFHAVSTLARFELRHLFECTRDGIVVTKNRSKPVGYRTTEAPFQLLG